MAPPAWARVAKSLGSTALAWLLAASVEAQTYQVLHSFAYRASDPSALITDASGNLYGTTFDGSESESGSGPVGTVFKLDAANNFAPTVLHTFGGTDGAHPYAALIADASGNLYGTTAYGGTFDAGTVFRLDASNNYALTTLHNFNGTDGLGPFAGVIADASGNLYGTTVNGGPTDQYGTVFKLEASSNYALTTLHDFNGSDGAYPGALLADASGNLYGISGGGALGFGIVFKLVAANNYTLTTLHDFVGGPDGLGPSGTLIADASGNLYGTTYSGGASNSGTAFMLDASKSYALTTLHSFEGTAGSSYGGLRADASGDLYGTTYGDSASAHYGTVFKLDVSNGYALTTLHSFGGSDGAYPGAAVIIDASGNLYGTTSQGGAFESGTVFQLEAANGYALTTLHTVGSPDPSQPLANLLSDASGNLYGTTHGGGPSNLGTVFMLNAANGYALTTLHNFGGPDGAEPQAGLKADASGNLYGTTYHGGALDHGTVFKLDVDNNYALTTLHDFGSDPSDGIGPSSTLIADAAGNLYGTTQYGLAAYGTVFKLDAANNYALTTIFGFPGFPDAQSPSGAIVADAEGNLYGTTFDGGPSYGGTVFRLDAANGYALTILHAFGGPDGRFPFGGVIADASGNLYGTTNSGGDYGKGTVFRLKAENNYALETLNDFSGSDGANPWADLIADASGNLYGATVRGGTYGRGTLFKLNAANGYPLTTLHSFGGEDGAEAWAGLIADASGNLLGTTRYGGTGRTGVVFSLSIGMPAPVTGIAPTSGPSGGGTAVTITGTDFSSALSVGIGGVLATGVTIVSSTEITALTPTLPPGRLNDVAVTKPFYGPSVPAVLRGAYFSDFLDVPQADIFHADVEKVFRNGITSGCGGGNYCRNNPVTRAQMAVFLLKAEHGPDSVPPPCTGVFDDVECTPTRAFAVDWIEQLANEGITGGCGGGNYCPGNPVGRGQMAAFLVKTFGLQ
jgi:uncharacterized repeat protein (TIGR03803 family)